MDLTQKQKDKIAKKLEKIEISIVDLKEGYLQKLEDEDPVASIKDELSGFLEEYRERFDPILEYLK